MENHDADPESRSPASLAPDDLELIEAIRRRDPDALGLLYQRHAQALLAVAGRILRDPGLAEEAVLDAFLQLWQNVQAYDPRRATPRAWLTVLTRSRALDTLRSRRTRTRFLLFLGGIQELAGLDRAATHEVGPLEGLARAERRGRLERALAGLDPRQRQAVELAFLEGLTHPEIADRLSLPLGTVKTRIRSGLKRMREHIDGLPDPGYLVP
ncbi:MAG: sigma-70 family RNA polymerase sigma factor [Myxococcota bacterium]|nr:sigma-70 family RNA polymerase sigma factor [Myxococcota bacterium]